MLLMTPGPTRVPERVLRAGARPMIHHRTPEFARELATMIELLGPVFGTGSPVLPVHATGRGALEATICNLFSAGDEIAVCCNGKFGEMWAAIAESYGLVVHRFATDWTLDVTPAMTAELLDHNPRIKAVALAYADTSTGVANDIRGIAATAGVRDVLTLVDGVSAIGGMEMSFDDWGIDVAVTASQKCLMSSPGMSFVAMSERAWSLTAASTLPRNYWDFAAIRREISKPKPETPGTTPVHLVLQVAEALRAIHEEGIANVVWRHDEMSARTRAGVEALGLSSPFPSLARQSTTVTAVALPESVTPTAVRDALKRRGILTAAGQGDYASTSFRIGHMGDMRIEDVDRTVVALGEALGEFRGPVRLIPG
jgi:aspartate aminotransferase-like enzyme